MWCARITWVLDALWPPRCVGTGCRTPGAWLCSACLARIPPLPSRLCRRCGEPVDRTGTCRRCRRRPPPYRRATAGGSYAGVLRDAVHALKFRGIRGLAAPLGALAAGSCAGIEADAIVVPVPSRRRRVSQRGIDHAHLLALAVGQALGCPVDGKALVRQRPTRPQVGLDVADRWRNVAGAFRAGDGVAGRGVVLVDDVLTTGATAEACAAALLAAGAREVDVCTVARAWGVPAGRPAPARL